MLSINMRIFSSPVGLVLMGNQMLEVGMRNLSRSCIRHKQWTVIFFVNVVSQKHDNKVKVSVCVRQINIDGISTISYTFLHQSVRFMDSAENSLFVVLLHFV